MGNFGIQHLSPSQSRIQQSNLVNSQTSQGRIKKTIEMHDSVFTSDPSLLSKGLQMYVAKHIAAHPDKQLAYYFPIGHLHDQVLENYKGKYSSQSDFVLFKDQSSCILKSHPDK